MKYYDQSEQKLEIRKWLNEHGYEDFYFHCFDEVIIYGKRKFDVDDLADLKKDLGLDLISGSLKCKGDSLLEIKYEFKNKKTRCLHEKISEWVKKCGKIRYYNIVGDINLIARSKLTEEEIENFEKEFDVTLLNRNVMYSSNLDKMSKITYRFY